MEINTVQPPIAGGSSQRSPTGELSSSDFLQLLVAQLTNQDPMAPTSNAALLDQLSSIREIELSARLSNSLETLTRNQKYGAAAGLIGKSVTGRQELAPPGGEPPSGEVVAIRFSPDGEVTLVLDSGDRLTLDQLETVQASKLSAESMIGRLVRGYDRSDPQNEFIEGIVTAIRKNETQGTVLELDTGESLSMVDLITTV